MESKIFITTLLCIFLSGCGHREKQPNGASHESFSEPEYTENFQDESFERNPGWDRNTETKKQPARHQAQGFKLHHFRDSRTGIVVSSSEYPSNWKVISKPLYTTDPKLPLFLMQIEGPNNFKSFNTPITFHITYPNPQIAYLMSQSSLAAMMKPMMGNNQIMREEVNDRMSKSGYTYVGIKNIPKVKGYIRQMLDKKGAAQAQLDYLATEWKNNQGQRALVTLVKIAMQQPILGNETMIGWFYSLDYVFVDKNEFENTIDQLTQSTIKTKENPKWNQYVMLLNQQRAKIAAQKHRIHMQDRRAAFDAHQQKMKGIWAAQDANHSSFMNKTFGPGSDTSQKRFLNMINEEETVYNPNTGINYQVQAGSKEYWMDSDGNYIKNDDLFYNPSGDINLNNREWIKVRGNY